MLKINETKKENVGSGSLKSAQRGITLIALVITIIVMLILVAVTITMAVNGGLFNYAGRAGKEAQNAINKEQDLANGGVNIAGVWYDSIEEYLSTDNSKYVVTDETDAGKTLAEVATVGECVAYNPGKGEFNWNSYSYSSTNFATAEDGTQTDFKASKYSGGWAVANISDDGCVYLISEKSVGNLYLYGMTAWENLANDSNNSILNKICEIYCNSTTSERGFCLSLTDKQELDINGDICNINEEYWINTANRRYWSNTYNIYYVAIIDNQGVVQYGGYSLGGPILSDADGTLDLGYNAGVRPVIKLKANIKTAGKNADGEWVLVAE